MMDQTFVTQSPPESGGNTTIKSQPTQLSDPTVTTKSTAYLRPTQAFTPSRSGHLNLDTFSPVNENGSFEFDRVLKTGKVYRRVKNKHVSCF